MTHIFYEDSWQEIKPKLKHFDNGRNHFLFSISEACLVKDSIVEDIKTSFKNSYAVITSNIGKDIGGKLVLIDLYLMLGIHSTYIIFLHDKKSPQTFVGESWKNNLYKVIDPANHELILKSFGKDSVGIVGAKEHIINEYNRETKQFVHNNAITHKFLKKYSISIDSYEFLSGTMYWMKSSIIEDFFTKHHPISLRKDLEAGNVLDNYDDTIAHTWERMFCWIAANYGYSIKGI
jgi:Lipopolysaccharide biosynthesis protein